MTPTNAKQPKPKHLKLLTDEQMNCADYVMANVGYSLPWIKRSARRFGFSLEQREDGTLLLTTTLGVFAPVQRDTQGRVYFRYREVRSETTAKRKVQRIIKSTNPERKQNRGLKLNGKSGSKEKGAARASQRNPRK